MAGGSKRARCGTDQEFASPFFLTVPKTASTPTDAGRRNRRRNPAFPARADAHGRQKVAPKAGALRDCATRRVCTSSSIGAGFHLRRSYTPASTTGRCFRSVAHFRLWACQRLLSWDSTSASCSAFRNQRSARCLETGTCRSSGEGNSGAAPIPEPRVSKLCQRLRCHWPGSGPSREGLGPQRNRRPGRARPPVRRKRSDTPGPRAAYRAPAGYERRTRSPG
jgi:hypothetical protein